MSNTWVKATTLIGFLVVTLSLSGATAQATPRDSIGGLALRSGSKIVAAGLASPRRHHFQAGRLFTPAQSSSLKQTCKASILRMPKRGHLLIFQNPGTWRQYITAFFSYGDVDDRCEAWQRISQIRPQIKKSGRWLDVTPEYPTKWDWTSMPLNKKSNEAVEAGLGLLGIPPRRQSPPQPRHVFVCRTHGHWDRVRLIMRNLMRNRSTGKIVAAGYKYWRVPVEDPPKHYKPCR